MQLRRHVPSDKDVPSHPFAPIPTKPVPPPPLSEAGIFRQLIVEEIRNGRLSRSRRKRIIRYAAQLNLSAVDVGRMIAECRVEMLLDSGAEDRLRALRLVEPPPERISAPLKIAGIILIAIVLDLLLISLFW